MRCIEIEERIQQLIEDQKIEFRQHVITKAKKKSTKEDTPDDVLDLLQQDLLLQQKKEQVQQQIKEMQQQLVGLHNEKLERLQIEQEVEWESKWDEEEEEEQNVTTNNNSVVDTQPQIGSPSSTSNIHIKDQ